MTWTSINAKCAIWLVRLLGIAAAGGTVAACGLSQPIPPVAEAGPPVELPRGAPLILDASDSFDPAGGRITRYAWTIVRTPAGRVRGLGQPLAPAAATPILTTTLPTEDTPAGVWEVELEVTDDEGLTATDVVTVTLIPSSP